MKTHKTWWSRSAAAAALLVAGGLVLSGCASGDAGTEDGAGDDTSSDTGLFSQELHDMLPEHVLSSGIIRAGSAFDTPPMLAANEQNALEAVGIAPDLGEHIAEVLGVEFEWTNVAWPGQLPGLDAGTFDVLWGQINTTEERESEIIDQVSMFRGQSGLLVPKGNPESIAGFGDTCGLTVGIPIGSVESVMVAGLSEDLCVSQDLPAIEINEYPNAAAMVTAVLAGQIDVMVDSVSAVRGIEEGNPDNVEAIAVDRAETLPYHAGLTAIGVSKDNPGLSTAIAGALQILHDEGIYQEVLTEWESDYAIMERDELVVNVLTGTPVGETAN